MSLKQTLFNEIKLKGLITLKDVYDICDTNGYKHDNSSRRLRELMANGSISPIKNSKKAIIGYTISNTSPEATECDYRGLNKKDDTSINLDKNNSINAFKRQIPLIDFPSIVKSPYDY